MSKKIRMISLLGFDQHFIGMFASYCHLLKPHFKDQWLLNRVDGNSEVLIVNKDFNGTINSKFKVKIIIGNFTSLKTSGPKNSKNNVFEMSYPISSSKLLNVLNQISEHRIIKNKTFSRAKQAFSFKNMFSRFMRNDNRKSEKKQPAPNKTNKIANTLLSLVNQNINKTLKVVFLGRPGSGKTTAIRSVSTGATLTSEVSATDSVSLIKEQTTIGIDYGECSFENGIKLRLYGTPGQKRYDYVQTQTVARADIYIILVDLSSVAPFAEFLYYKEIIQAAGNLDALRVVAFTHYDFKEHNMAQLSKEIRHKCHGEVLTVKIDTRVRDEVHFMLEKASEMKVGRVSAQQYYAENNLFLKNINV